MKKLFLIIMGLYVITGCSYAKVYAQNHDTQKYSKTELILSDVSTKITGYYYNTGIPSDFDEKQFVYYLEHNYRDKEAVKLLKSYELHVRVVGNGYSVMLCDEDGMALMEDFSCTMSKVDIRYWDSDVSRQCQYEENWSMYCQ